MADHSAIGWTHTTWNPVAGCTRVSAGCDHCYAAALAAGRLRNTRQYRDLAVVTPRGDAAFNGRIRLLPERLQEPLHWRTPRLVFVNSMSDLFHERIPDGFVAHVFAVMAAAPQHSFQVLTKRPTRMRQLLASTPFWAIVAQHGIERWWTGRELVMVEVGTETPLPNVWLGVSCEDQRTADERIPLLLETPAAVRFVSLEPLLGPIDLWEARYAVPGGGLGSAFNWGRGLNWVIVGGESGREHRPMDPAWVESIAAECTAAAVPLFVKQDSGHRPGQQGRLSDPLWACKEYPSTPAVPS